MQGGYLQLFRVNDAPVRLHWSVLALMLLRYEVGNRSMLELAAFVVIILVHELGHALFVRACGLRVREIRLLPFGGECVHDATSNHRHNVLIAWGGVLAQLWLFVLAFVVTWIAQPTGAVAEFLAPMFIANLGIAAFNLLPFAPLDGYTAWKLKGLFGKKSSKSRESRPPHAPRAAREPQVVINSPIGRRKSIDALVDNALLEARRAASKKREDESAD